MTMPKWAIETEAARAAFKAHWEADDAQWDAIPPESRTFWCDIACAALEAAIPHIRRAALEEAARLVETGRNADAEFIHKDPPDVIAAAIRSLVEEPPQGWIN
jgi:hypothetical protein